MQIYPITYYSSKRVSGESFPHPSPKVTPASNGTKTTTTGLTTFKTPTRTKLHHPTREMTEVKLSHLWGNKSRSWTHLSPSFP